MDLTEARKIIYARLHEVDAYGFRDAEDDEADAADRKPTWYPERVFWPFAHFLLRRLGVIPNTVTRQTMTRILKAKDEWIDYFLRTQGAKKLDYIANANVPQRHGATRPRPISVWQGKSDWTFAGEGPTKEEIDCVPYEGLHAGFAATHPEHGIVVGQFGHGKWDIYATSRSTWSALLSSGNVQKVPYRGEVCDEPYDDGGPWYIRPGALSKG